MNEWIIVEFAEWLNRMFLLYDDDKIEGDVRHIFTSHEIIEMANSLNDIIKEAKKNEPIST